jgi:dolichol-phosphate mannosyltransferase
MDVLNGLPERHRFLRGLVSWTGFRQKGIVFDRAPRHAGESKYNLIKMLELAGDGITSFSTQPLRLATYLGFLTFTFSLLYIVVILIQRLFTHTTIRGWSSTMITILFLGSVQLISLGIVGEYVGRIYDEIKNRPPFIIEEELNFEHSTIYSRRRSA